MSRFWDYSRDIVAGLLWKRLRDFSCRDNSPTININFILFNNENYKTNNLKNFVCSINWQDSETLSSRSSLSSPTNTIIDMHVVVHDFNFLTFLDFFICLNLGTQFRTGFSCSGTRSWKIRVLTAHTGTMALHTSWSNKDTKRAIQECASSHFDRQST